MYVSHRDVYDDKNHTGRLTAESELSLGWVGLGWVGSIGNGSRIFVFSGLGWVVRLK